MRSKNIKAVVFDLDGTLLDTIDDISDAMNRVFEKRNLPLHNRDEYKAFIGDGIYEFVKDALPDTHRQPKILQQCVSEMRQEYTLCWNNKTQPYSGISELLNELCSRNLLLGVLSNKPHDFTQMMVRELMPHWPFDPVVGAREHIPPKPDPAGALEVAARMKLLSSECIYVGDSENDVLTAQRAGMVSVAVTWGFRSREQLLLTGADCVINRPAQLTGCL